MLRDVALGVRSRSARPSPSPAIFIRIRHTTRSRTRNIATPPPTCSTSSWRRLLRRSADGLRAVVAQVCGPHPLASPTRNSGSSALRRYCGAPFRWKFDSSKLHLTKRKATQGNLCPNDAPLYFRVAELGERSLTRNRSPLEIGGSLYLNPDSEIPL